MLLIVHRQKIHLFIAALVVQGWGCLKPSDERVAKPATPISQGDAKVSPAPGVRYRFDVDFDGWPLTETQGLKLHVLSRLPDGAAWRMAGSDEQWVPLTEGLSSIPIILEFAGYGRLQIHLELVNGRGEILGQIDFEDEIAGSEIVRGAPVTLSISKMVEELKTSMILTIRVAFDTGQVPIIYADVKPTIDGNCVAFCHDSRTMDSDLDLSQFPFASPSRGNDQQLIVTRSAARMRLAERPMPPPGEGAMVPSVEVDLMERWLNDGLRMAISPSRQDPDVKLVQVTWANGQADLIESDVTHRFSGTIGPFLVDSEVDFVAMAIDSQGQIVARKEYSNVTIGWNGRESWELIGDTHRIRIGSQGIREGHP